MSQDRTFDVRFDRVAVGELRNAFEYVRDSSGHGRAASWLRAMRSGIQALESFPLTFPVVCIRRGRAIRSKLVLSHRIFYFVDQPRGLVYVIDIVHTARETRLAEDRDDTK